MRNDCKLYRSKQCNDAISIIVRKALGDPLGHQTSTRVDEGLDFVPLRANSPYTVTFLLYLVSAGEVALYGSSPSTSERLDVRMESDLVPTRNTRLPRDAKAAIRSNTSSESGQHPPRRWALIKHIILYAGSLEA